MGKCREGRADEMIAVIRCCRHAGVLAAALLLAALLVAAPNSPADGLRAGLWPTRQSPEINGVVGPIQQNTRCLTPEAVADLDKTFGPLSRTTNSTCERIEHEISSQRLKWRLQCTGQI